MFLLKTQFNNIFIFRYLKILQYRVNSKCAQLCCYIQKAIKIFVFVESDELTITLEYIAVCAVTSGIVVIKLNLNVPLPPASSKTKMYSIFTTYKI